MSTQDKNKLEQTFDGFREGHSGKSDEDWRECLHDFLQAQTDISAPFKITEISRPNSGLSMVNIFFTLEQEASSARYVARIEPEQSIFTEYDLYKQYQSHCYLNSIGLPVPNALWMDKDGSYFGQPGFIMEFWPGDSSTTSYFTDGPLSNASESQRDRMLHNMVSAIAKLHSKADPTVVSGLKNRGQGEDWIEREINYWADVAMQAHPQLASFYNPIREWLISSAPPLPDPVFLHGDFNCSNVLWDGENICAILDLESILIGARESDVVYHFILDQIAGHFFTTGINTPSLAQRALWYKETSGVELTNLDYHEVRITFQLACAAVAIARFEQQDLISTPTPFMNYLNRRLVPLLPFEHQMPISNS